MKSFRLLVLLFAISITAVQFTGAQNWGNGIKGQGPKVTKNLNIDAFDGIALSISADVYLRQGSPQSVKIEAQQNIIDNLETAVKEGTWKIGFDKNVRGHDGVKIWITVDDLRKIGVSGSGNVTGEGKFTNLGDLTLWVTGSGDIMLESSSKAMDVSISGSGDVKLKGTTGACDMKITGSGNISAFDLEATSCSVKITGSGDSSVNVREQLDVAIVGSGDVYYKGRPSVRSKITGSGDVRSK